MIVITNVKRDKIKVRKGDIFRLSITDRLGTEVVLKETVTKNRIIDFIAIFRFALEDGTSQGFHLSGIFANSKELPKEIQEAILFEDLTSSQKNNFRKSIGTRI